MCKKIIHIFLYKHRIFLALHKNLMVTPLDLELGSEMFTFCLSTVWYFYHEHVFLSTNKKAEEAHTEIKMGAQFFIYINYHLYSFILSLRHQLIVKTSGKLPNLPQAFLIYKTVLTVPTSGGWWEDQIMRIKYLAHWTLSIS